MGKSAVHLSLTAVTRQSAVTKANVFPHSAVIQKMAAVMMRPVRKLVTVSLSSLAVIQLKVAVMTRLPENPVTVRKGNLAVLRIQTAVIQRPAVRRGSVTPSHAVILTWTVVKMKLG